MMRLAISVEGQTEEAFVKRILEEEMRHRGIDVVPILLGRARNREQGGGRVTIDRLTREMRHLKGSFDAVTCLVDLYGFHGREADESVEDLEGRILDHLEQGGADPRYMIPYVQKHEFESILFSDVEAFGRIGSDLMSGNAMDRLRSIRDDFQDPECIDDGPETAPGKRIRDTIPRYRKVLHGPAVAEATGLARIRDQCPRFDDWLRKLEGLGT